MASLSGVVTLTGWDDVDSCETDLELFPVHLIVLGWLWRLHIVFRQSAEKYHLLRQDNLLLHAGPRTPGPAAAAACLPTQCPAARNHCLMNQEHWSPLAAGMAPGLAAGCQSCPRKWWWVSPTLVGAAEHGVAEEDPWAPESSPVATAVRFGSLSASSRGISDSSPRGVPSPR